MEVNTNQQLLYYKPLTISSFLLSNSFLQSLIHNEIIVNSLNIEEIFGNFVIYFAGLQRQFIEMSIYPFLTPENISSQLGSRQYLAERQSQYQGANKLSQIHTSDTINRYLQIKRQEAKVPKEQNKNVKRYELSPRDYNFVKSYTRKFDEDRLHRIKVGLGPLNNFERSLHADSQSKGTTTQYHQPQGKQDSELKSYTGAQSKYSFKFGDRFRQKNEKNALSQTETEIPTSMNSYCNQKRENLQSHIQNESKTSIGDCHQIQASETQKPAQSTPKIDNDEPKQSKRESERTAALLVYSKSQVSSFTQNNFRADSQHQQYPFSPNSFKGTLPQSTKQLKLTDNRQVFHSSQSQQRQQLVKKSAPKEVPNSCKESSIKNDRLKILSKQKKAEQKAQKSDFTKEQNFEKLLKTQEKQMVAHNNQKDDIDYKLQEDKSPHLHKNKKPMKLTPEQQFAAGSIKFQQSQNYGQKVTLNSSEIKKRQDRERFLIAEYETSVYYGDQDEQISSGSELSIKNQVQRQGANNSVDRQKSQQRVESKSKESSQQIRAVKPERISYDQHSHLSEISPRAKVIRFNQGHSDPRMFNNQNLKQIFSERQSSDRKEAQLSELKRPLQKKRSNNNCQLETYDALEEQEKQKFGEGELVDKAVNNRTKDQADLSICPPREKLRERKRVTFQSQSDKQEEKIFHSLDKQSKYKPNDTSQDQVEQIHRSQQILQQTVGKTHLIEKKEVNQCPQKSKNSDKELRIQSNQMPKKVQKANEQQRKVQLNRQAIEMLEMYEDTTHTNEKIVTSSRQRQKAQKQPSQFESMVKIQSSQKPAPNKKKQQMTNSMIAQSQTIQLPNRANILTNTSNLMIDEEQNKNTASGNTSKPIIALKVEEDGQVSVSSKPSVVGTAKQREQTEASSRQNPSEQALTTDDNVTLFEENSPTDDHFHSKRFIKKEPRHEEAANNQNFRQQSIVLQKSPLKNIYKKTKAETLSISNEHIQDSEVPQQNYSALFNEKLLQEFDLVKEQRDFLRAKFISHLELKHSSELPYSRIVGINVLEQKDSKKIESAKCGQLNSDDLEIIQQRIPTDRFSTQTKRVPRKIVQM